MIDYLEIAARALECLQARPEPDRGPPTAPDTVRAATTGEAGEVWISYYEWKARELNWLFQEQGVTGGPGHITAETVRDGLSRRSRTRHSEANE